MRIFIAIDPPEKIKDEIEKIRKGFRGIYGKPVERENFHITLKFIGVVQPNIFEKIKEELKNINYNKFSIKIGNIGTFGDRVVWKVYMKDMKI
ncbi:RNA 2',3'-cyclic phosphodiesterase [Candidatus Nanopusillus massiliensis]|uniref:RNA 2',3'-cyclic phosphodiesterase n=1 Tax=Candidatus Nanopusillus massiliensis TaxID=2897163 RepID=UPI001E2DA559|nr:RNA 2',3'-cyclic phosphodiesterase [Candidatus Nanopusillus massiliensis]